MRKISRLKINKLGKISWSEKIVNTFSFYPDKTTYITEQELPHQIHLVSIKTIDNLLIQGLYFSQNKVTVNSKLIIYFHGNSENMYRKISEATNLFQMGFDVLVVSYRGYARSQGNPTEKGVYIDGKSSLQYAVITLGYDIKNIVIYGYSIGTAVAVDISQNQNISKLILVAPLTTGIEVSQASWFKFLGFLVGSQYESLYKINNVKCPLLIIHGAKDKVIPYKLGLRLYKKYNGIKTMITITNGGHDNLLKINPDLYWSSIRKFLENN